MAGWIALSPELGTAMAAYSRAAVYDREPGLPMRGSGDRAGGDRQRQRMRWCALNTRDADGPGCRADEDLYSHAPQWRTGRVIRIRNGWPQSSPTAFATVHTELRDDEGFDAAASTSPMSSWPTWQLPVRCGQGWDECCAPRHRPGVPDHPAEQIMTENTGMGAVIGTIVNSAGLTLAKVGRPPTARFADPGLGRAPPARKFREIDSRCGIAFTDAISVVG